MAIFYEDDKSPIISELIRQGFDVDESEVLRILDIDENAHNTDSNISLGTGAACIATTAGILALSGLTLPILVPAIGVFLSGVSYWNSKITARDRETESEFIHDHPEVLTKVQTKIKSGASRDSIAAAYQQVLRSYRWGDEVPLDRVLGNSQTSNQTQQGIQPSNDQDGQTEKLGIGSKNWEFLSRGNPNCRQAIEVVPIATTAAAAPSMQHITSPVWNPAQDLGENPQSALIVGVPGSGKGMLVSNAIRTLKNKHPDLTIFVIDPKADPKERGYWEGLADRYEAFSLMKCSDPDEGAEWLLKCMAEFTALPGPKLCIFDELMSASTELTLANKELKALSRLKKFVVGLIGQGDSQGAWLWAMTQSPQVSDMGMSGGVRANLRAIGLVSPKNMAAVEALTSTKLIPPPPGGMDELRQIMKASPVNRAVFDGKLARWLPMPKLENHSGFDRDSRKIEREQPIGPPSSSGPYAEDISGTWREDFANSLPPGLSESEFMARYKLEKTLQESSSEVETVAIVDTRPDGLEQFPTVEIIWNYLKDKEPRNFKQIANAMRKSGQISEDDLMKRLPHLESFNDGIKQVVIFGVSKGLLTQISDDTFQALEKH